MVHFMYELQGQVQTLFPSEAILLGELSGFDARSQQIDRASAVHRITRAEDIATGRDRFSGKWVRHPLITAGLTGGGPVSETSTWNVPHTLQTDEAQIKLVRTLWPISLSVDAERDTQSNETSQRSAVTTMTMEASSALARQENLMVNGDGTGKVSDISGGSSPGLTITLSSTGLAPMDEILPGKVYDIRTKSTGAATGNGIGRIVDSVSDTAGGTQTVTFSTNAFGPGNSGNITFSTSEGLYIHDDSATQAGYTAANAGTYASQGIEQVAAITGTFEGIDKAAAGKAWWQGTDGRQGDTSTAALSASMLNKAVRVGRRSGLGKWDFLVGDPAVIDLFKDSLQSQVRYDPQVTTLKSGFSGIVYDGADAPIICIKEPLHKKGAAKLIDKASLVLYGDDIGPKFLDDDGSLWRRFARALPKEADLLDRWNFAAKKCNTTVFLNNLQQAV